MTDPNGREITYETHAKDFSIIVSHQGNAPGVRDQFTKSDPELLAAIVSQLHDTAAFMGGEVHTRLGNIAADLADAWQGTKADDAVAIIKVLQGDAATIGTNATIIESSFRHFHDDWVTQRQLAMALTDDQDDAAHTIFSTFTQAESNAMQGMPNSLTAHLPFSSGGGGGGGVPHGGPILPGTGPGLGSTPFHAGGAGLGGLGGGGSSLAGAGVGGLGDAGLGTSGTGLGATGGGAGLGGATPPGGAGGAGAGGSGFLPPFGGGGGGGNDEQERERTTWLDEDDDIWGGGDAPTNVIT